MTESLVDMVLREAKKHQANKITGVNLVIGELSGIEEECVKFYFDILTEDTPAYKAKLNVKFEKALFKCPSCGHTFERKNFTFSCPRCGNPGILSEQGRGLYIESIEVE